MAKPPAAAPSPIPRLIREPLSTIVVPVPAGDAWDTSVATPTPATAEANPERATSIAATAAGGCRMTAPPKTRLLPTASAAVRPRSDQCAGIRDANRFPERTPSPNTR